MKRLALLNILIFLSILASSVSASTFMFIDEHHDHFYLLAHDTGEIVQIGYDLTENWRYDTSVNESGRLFYLPDGGVQYVGESGSALDRLRLNPDGTINPNELPTSTYSPSSSGTLRGLNRVNEYVYASGLAYTYASTSELTRNQVPQSISIPTNPSTRMHDTHEYERFGRTGRIFGTASSTSGQTSPSIWLYSSEYGFLDSDVSLNGFSMDRRVSIERHPTISVTDPSRVYQMHGMPNRRAYDFSNRSMTSYPASLFTPYTPTGFNTRSTHVWRANNNRYVMVGDIPVPKTNESTTNQNSYTIIDRNNNFIGGATGIWREYNTRYIDVMELPNGDLLMLEWRSDRSARIHRLPVTGATQFVELDFSVSPSSWFAYDNELEHYRQGSKMGLIPFSVLPKDVLEYQINPSFSDVPEWLEYTYIDEFDKEVHVTISDVVLDNFPVEMLVGHPTRTSLPKFSSIALNRDLLRVHNTSMITSIGSETITNATGSATKADYDIFEFVFEYSLQRQGSQGSVYSYVDFIASESLVDWGDNVSDRLAFEKRYSSPSDSIFNSMIRSYWAQSDVIDLENLTLLTSERHAGGSIDTFVVRVFVDTTTTPHKFQTRKEVSRSGAPDTVTSSVWTPFIGFLPGEVDNATVEEITIHVPESDTTVQVAFRSYGHVKKPLWTTGYESDHPNASNARESQAFILDDGENTIRTYYTSDVHATVRNSLSHYEDWTYVITLNNATILGIDDSPFTPTPTPTDPSGDPAGGSWLRPFGGFSLAQSTFVYTVAIILLTWIIIMAYSIYVANLTGASWVTTLGAVASAIASMMWVFVSVFIGWTPVWVVVLLIVLGAGIVTVAFRRTFVT